MAVVLLVGGGALAQQGLIVQPWRKSATPVVRPAPAAFNSAMPASGLPSERRPPAPVAGRTKSPVIEAAPVVTKWTPPVVALLVDPWAKPPVVAAAPRRSWMPRTTDIVDPWAAATTRVPARESSHRAGAAHSPIF